MYLPLALCLHLLVPAKAYRPPAGYRFAISNTARMARFLSLRPQTLGAGVIAIRVPPGPLCSSNDAVLPIQRRLPPGFLRFGAVLRAPIVVLSLIAARAREIPRAGVSRHPAVGNKGI